ncbi:hypothetical protein SISSUDRAFT_1043348 [Sistotremastrum suecicum HHB10207 ss-3]|uniref:C2H2-type domain-containing protein n=1 Tax=Sistotremastrum suecicum HHB10207 ss-3 TaxID=1314776 RepID=A0A166FVQ5_9AGAM|nr:hypothetical protein SISSUDRAFT_1043348 [Sistotremastrum suecicum HHB10207 ss-3]
MSEIQIDPKRPEQMNETAYYICCGTLWTDRRVLLNHMDEVHKFYNDNNVTSPVTTNMTLIHTAVDDDPRVTNSNFNETCQPTHQLESYDTNKHTDYDDSVSHVSDDSDIPLVSKPRSLSQQKPMHSKLLTVPYQPPTPRLSSPSDIDSSSDVEKQQQVRKRTRMFKCPYLGCDKIYRQQNGLKYHVNHGWCSFEIEAKPKRRTNKSE